MKPSARYRWVSHKIGFMNGTIWGRVQCICADLGIYLRSLGTRRYFLADGSRGTTNSRDSVRPCSRGSSWHGRENIASGYRLGFAHGFEVVQSIFRGWRFSTPDTVAAFGLHATLLIGPCDWIAAHVADWSRPLSTFEIDLKRDAESSTTGMTKVASKEISPPCTNACF